MNQESKEKIKDILRSCVANAITRTQKNISENKSYKPFHQALLTDEIVKTSSFERSFSTSFGQGPMEKISEIVAASNGYETHRQHEIQINVFKGAVDEAERISAALRSGNQKPHWKKEVETITAFKKGDTVVRRVISDLWLEKNGVETFISIKTVKPNLDQTEIAKKDMLLLKAENPAYQTFLGLYYNPYGELRTNYAHSIPMKIFDMHNDECVLIGKDYWNLLGGSNTYEKLLEIFSEVGKETKPTLLSL